MLLVYLFTALAVSFLCSLFEAVLLTVSHAHVEKLYQSGTKAGALLKTLKTDLDRSLSAILTLNTIAHTVGAAGVGAEVQQNYGNQWLALSSGILTFLILVLSEILPKVLGATYALALSPLAAFGIRGLILITYPLVVLFEGFAKIITRGRTSFPRVSREELMLVAEIGLNEGILSEKETATIRNLLRLQKVSVREIMTPRSVAFFLHKDLTVQDVMENHPHIPFSRIPVYDQTPDKLVGMVLRYEILEGYSEGNIEQRLESLMVPIQGVPFSQSVSTLLDSLIKEREHLYAVYDEHGGVAGIVTLEDAIETLLGVEIVDEFDSVEDMRKFARDQWNKRKLHHHKATTS